jgi:3-dehydroquinate synthase
MINRPEIIDKLFEYDRSNDSLLDEIISLCIEDKRDVVLNDEFEHGERALLNFGHTAAHAIEKLSDYAITHGSAVAIGMMIVARASVNMGLCTSDTPEILAALLNKFSLPSETEYSAEMLAEAALGDKKRSGNKINLILSYGVGDARICPTDIDELCEIFRKGSAK